MKEKKKKTRLFRDVAAGAVGIQSTPYVRIFLKLNCAYFMIVFDDNSDPSILLTMGTVYSLLNNVSFVNEFVEWS